MARNDPYLPAPANPASSTSVTFDGSTSSTGTAIVSGLAGNFDAEIYLEAYDGSSWQEVSQLETDTGTLTFGADWSTQFNRLMVSQNDRRIRIDNVDSTSGWVAIDGDER